MNILFCFIGAICCVFISERIIEKVKSIFVDVAFYKLRSIKFADTSTSDEYKINQMRNISERYAWAFSENAKRSLDEHIDRVEMDRKRMKWKGDSK